MKSYKAKHDFGIGGKNVKKGDKIDEGFLSDLSPDMRVSLLKSGNLEEVDVKAGEEDMLIPHGPAGSAKGERTPEMKERDAKAEEQALAHPAPAPMPKPPGAAPLAPTPAPGQPKTEERSATPANAAMQAGGSTVNGGVAPKKV